MERDQLQRILELHQKWLDNNPDGVRADLSEADLRGADLRGADLHGADFDFACWPLWCGSLGVRVCKRIAVQIAYHFCRLVCDDPEVKRYQRMLAPLANQFHRVDECGRIEEAA